MVGLGLCYNGGMGKRSDRHSAHYDGQTIVLDAPVTLEANARLLVTILDAGQAALVYEVMAASAASLARVWDNDEDAVYDEY